MDPVGVFVVAAIFVGFAALVVYALRKAKQDRAKSEAFFRAMFPDIATHFHPERVLEFAQARLARGTGSGAYTWDNPPGFPSATRAEVTPAPKGERFRLLDAGGKPIAEFTWEDHPEGGALRVGKGKLTASLRAKNDPAVRYWHPEREFKWSRLKGWRFTTPMTEESFDSNSSGTQWSSDSSSSSSVAPAAAAGAAGAAIVAAGGAFDGGGASEGWSEGGGAGSESSSSESSSATAY